MVLFIGSNAEFLLQLIAKYDAVLATGHISPREFLIILQQAREFGIERMLVTHASESVSAFTEEEQQRAVNLQKLLTR